MAEKLGPPEISVGLSITPARFTVNYDNHDLPTLTVTATLHASQPITIFIEQQIFNLGPAPPRTNFTLVNLTTKHSRNLSLEGGGCKRCSPNRTKGSPDDEYFVTLEPGGTVTWSKPFSLARYEKALTEGRRYSFAVQEGQEIREWWYGSRKEAMASRSILEWMKIVRKHRPLLRPGGEPIQLSAAPLEFEILEPEAISG